MSNLDPALERAVAVASWLFLVGIVMIVSTAVPAVQRRAPRILGYGVLVVAGSFLLVGVSWALLR